MDFFLSTVHKAFNWISYKSKTVLDENFIFILSLRKYITSLDKDSFAQLLNRCILISFLFALTDFIFLYFGYRSILGMFPKLVCFFIFLITRMVIQMRKEMRK